MELRDPGAERITKGGRFRSLDRDT